MSIKFVSPKLMWRAVMDKIVQDVPHESSFCEFECKRVRCTLETTGDCDIHPNLSLVLPALVTITPDLPNRAAAWAPAQSQEPNEAPQPC